MLNQGVRPRAAKDLQEEEKGKWREREELSCKGREGYRNPVTWFALISLYFADAGANLNFWHVPWCSSDCKSLAEREGSWGKESLANTRTLSSPTRQFSMPNHVRTRVHFFGFLSAFGSLVIFFGFLWIFVTRVCEFCESHCLKLTSLTRHRSRFRQNCRSTSKRSWMRSIGRKTSLQQQMLPLHRVPRRLGGLLFHRVQTKVLVSWSEVFQELFLSWILFAASSCIFSEIGRQWSSNRRSTQPPRRDKWETIFLLNTSFHHLFSDFDSLATILGWIQETAAGLNETAQLPSTLAMEGTQVALNILLRAEDQKKKQIQVTEKELRDSNDTKAAFSVLSLSKEV